MQNPQWLHVHFKNIFSYSGRFIYAGKADAALYPRLSKVALNRWHLAVTLMRNPQLQIHRVRPDVPRNPYEITKVQHLSEVDTTSLPSLRQSVNNDENFLLENIGEHYRKLELV